MLVGDQSGEGRPGPIPNPELWKQARVNDANASILCFPKRESESPQRSEEYSDANRNAQHFLADSGKIQGVANHFYYF